jgi:hypothetical protein
LTKEKKQKNAFIALDKAKGCFTHPLLLLLPAPASTPAFCHFALSPLFLE